MKEWDSRERTRDIDADRDLMIDTKKIRTKKGKRTFMRTEFASFKWASVE